MRLIPRGSHNLLRPTRAWRARTVSVALAGIALACVVSDAAAQTTDDFFNDATVQELRFFVNAKDWATLKATFDQNTYYPADLHWNGLVVQNVGIRSRGGGSRSGTKPSLRVDFNRYISDQKFLGLGSFILDNAKQDPTTIRERIAMKFFQRLGMPAPREAHARFYVNNEYIGLYIIIEEVDKRYLARIFGEHDGDTENDGHLFQYSWVQAYYLTYLGSDLAPYAAMFDPHTHENASQEKLYRTIEKMIGTINNASDADFESAVSPYLDLKLFIKQVAIENMLAEWDGILGYAGMNNFYFYRFEQKDLSQFLPWDKDNTFRALDYPIMSGVDENVLMRRAMQVPTLRATYFQELLNAAVSADELDPDTPGLTKRGWLEAEAIREYNQIKDASVQDTNKPFTNEQVDQGVAELMAIARGRGKFVRCEVTKIIDPAGAAAVCAATP